MTLVARPSLQKWILILAALFAIVWAVIRACLQSITMDEAQTYLFFVAGSRVWYPFSNNHVLNSLLMWITTHAFGNSILTVRLPALMGGALYVGVCYFLCRSITDRFALQISLFICLTYNPLICDFMVAARGYSLADAFLLAAIAVPVWHRVNAPSLPIAAALASLALGLSFSANFSFAFVDLAASLGILAWAIRHRGADSIVLIAGLCALPGLFLTLLICGYPLVHMQREDLWWGAHSLREMTQSLVQSSLYRLDPRFRGYRLFKLIDAMKTWLLPLLGTICFCQVVVTSLDGSWSQDACARWMRRFGTVLAGIAALSVLMSWLALRFAGLPLPMGRTGIYLVPLCTLVAGILAAAPARSVAAQWLRRGITATLICLACYFALCLRLTQFKEYEWDADLKDVYSVLARLNHAYGVKDVAANGLYQPSLNYYRVSSGAETFSELTELHSDAPARFSIYVLDGSYERKFIAREKLLVIYKGKTTGVVVAVRSDGLIPPTMVER